MNEILMIVGVPVAIAGVVYVIVLLHKNFMKKPEVISVPPTPGPVVYPPNVHEICSLAHKHIYHGLTDEERDELERLIQEIIHP